jgi:hypothetical protein
MHSFIPPGPALVETYSEIGRVKHMGMPFRQPGAAKE